MGFTANTDVEVQSGTFCSKRSCECYV